MSTQKSDTYVVTQVPANVADSGKVRLGGAYPSLTPVRAAITRYQTLSDNRDVKTFFV
jgi:hypothetical protein